MHAKPFQGDADGPDLVIIRADDGTLLPKCRGWTCGWCETLWAAEAEAEACCAAPVRVLLKKPERVGRLRLYVPE